MNTIISHTDLRLISGNWPFAMEHQTDIAAHWANACKENPALWNGRVFIARNMKINGNTLCADMFETDFADYLAWRDWGFPDTTAYNIFGLSIVISSQNDVILGRMASHTVRAGYFAMPGGALDRTDLRPDGTIDIVSSTARELTEEIGLDADEAKPGARFITINKQQVSLNSIFQFDCTTSDLLARISDKLAAMKDQEFDQIITVTTPEDLNGLKLDPYTRRAIEQYFAHHATSRTT